MTDSKYSKKSPWPKIAIASVAIILITFLGLKKLSSKEHDNKQEELVVYCAAGIKLPIEEITKNYSQEFGKKVTLEYGSSGELEAKLQQDASYGKNRADLYIPADYTFSKRTQEKGLSFESLPMAKFELVLAVKPTDDLNIDSVTQLLEQKIPFVICNEKAGAGKKTMKGLKASNHWDDAKAAAKVVVPTVTEAANTIKTANDVRAGFIWNTTAKQFNLKVIKLKELSALKSSINVNVTKKNDATAALHLARYLSSPEKGQKAFEKFGFTANPGDAWQSAPTLTLFSGGVNKPAVEKTIAEFEAREGVTINAVYDGCGTLVTSMSAQEAQGTFPDIFLTCDKSYMNKVGSEFDTPEDLSSTEIVMLVRKGNPLNIQTLDDLTKPGIKVGTADPRKTTLGYLSWKMFRETGIEDKMKTNVIVTAPTAHKIITQFMAHNKLDASLVYRANCNQVLDEYELMPIAHPLATAVQNIAVSRKTDHPLMMSRLIERLKSPNAQNRYLTNGFKLVHNQK